MKFSNLSRQPRKQRKAIYSSALHTMRKYLHAHLSKELRTAMGKRSVLAAKGDGVKVLKGKFKGVSGKINGVNLKTGFVTIEGMMVKRQNGKEIPATLRPNQFIITEIASSRKIKQGAGKAKKVAPTQAVEKAPAAVAAKA